MRRGVIVKTLRCCAELNCRGCPLEKLREGRGCTTKLAKEVLKQMQADDAERRKQYAQTLQKAIAIDFDGCLCANAYPDIGAPNWEIIVAAAAEQIGWRRTHSLDVPRGRAAGERARSLHQMGPAFRRRERQLAVVEEVLRERHPQGRRD